MIRTTLISIAAVMATSTAAASYDYSHSGRIDSREAAQAHRIEQGRRTGQLTWWETFRLRAEQRRVHDMERWAKRDGVITRGEARRIEYAQDRASRDIARERHDGQVSWWRRWY